MLAKRRAIVKSEAVFSTPTPTLVDMSNKSQVMVFGFTDQGALARVVLGSVSPSVVRHTNCAVAIIRNEDLLMPNLQHPPVRLAVESSPPSDFTTAIAFNEVSRRGIDLIALHLHA